MLTMILESHGDYDLYNRMYAIHEVRYNPPCIAGLAMERLPMARRSWTSSNVFRAQI